MDERLGIRCLALAHRRPPAHCRINNNRHLKVLSKGLGLFQPLHVLTYVQNLHGQLFP